MGTHPIFESDFDCLTQSSDMSDHEEEFDFDQAGSGASLTYPKQCSALRKNEFVMIKGHACKIVDMSTSKTGKHGHAKVHMVALDIFDGKKYEDICPSTHNMECPTVKRTEYQLIKFVLTSFPSIPNIRMVCSNHDKHMDNGRSIHTKHQHQGSAQHRQISFRTSICIHMVCSIHKVCSHSIHTKHQHQQISFHTSICIHMVCSIRNVHSIHTMGQHWHQHLGQILRPQLVQHQQTSCHSIPSIRMVCSIHDKHMGGSHSIRTKHQHRDWHQHQQLVQHRQLVQHQQIFFHTSICIRMVCSIHDIHSIHTMDQLQHQDLVRT